MAVINSIENGIVIDHITAGLGVKILDYLKVDASRGSVAFIMNASSKKHGRKDVIKLENLDDIDLAVLGLLDNQATVNVIENHVITRKIKLELPKTVSNVIKCRNPRCVTSIESNIPHIFHLVEEETKEYRCEFCDEIVSMNNK